jgi:RNase P/RNase MRP subunit p30
VRFLSCLRREVAVAQEFRLPIVISSGASELMLMRKPREVAVLASLFGLTGDAALDAVSQNPAALVERNRQKLSAGFVAPGIQLIKQGEDC